MVALTPEFLSLTVSSWRPIPNNFPTILTSWSKLSSGLFARMYGTYTKCTKATKRVARGCQGFCVSGTRCYDGVECRTRSNQMHLTIEFQAGEEESDSHTLADRGRRKYGERRQKRYRAAQRR